MSQIVTQLAVVFGVLITAILIAAGLIFVERRLLGL